MCVLEAFVLNWFQYQFSKETVMDMNTNSLVWMLIELAHGISVGFQYQIMFGWQTMELHSAFVLYASNQNLSNLSSKMAGT